MLNPAVRVIQGDGMNLDTHRGARAHRDRRRLRASTTSPSAWAAACLQKLDRDTLRFAMKANEIVVNGERRDVSKAPVTDPTKASKAGRLAVVAGPDGSILTTRKSTADPARNLLAPVWRNGRLLRDFTFDEVRRNAALTTPAAASAAA